MPRRSPGVLSTTASRFSAGARLIEAQREPHAAFWDAWNADAAAADGPLWVALGDSSSQGIGSPDPADGWVPRMTHKLRAETGDPWRSINLAITGAQLSDVLTLQLPRLLHLQADGQTPQLTSHLAGANDLLAPFTWPGTKRTLNAVLDQLPANAVVARVGTSNALNGFMGRMINRNIERAAETRPFHLFWPWDWPARDGSAEDKWHPNPTGYSYMVDLIWPRIQDSLSASAS
jgi:lysophospholipase L1-like esterase